MKVLISHDTNILPASAENAARWNVDKILVNGTDTNEDLGNVTEDYPEVSTFFIPVIFDKSNSFSYDGVDFALRILLKFLYEKRHGVNIVLLGIESRDAFLLHFKYPNILKLPGVYYGRFNQQSVTDFPDLDTSRLDFEIYRRPLDNLGIRMPSSFKSTHSLTNEWCLYKWGQYMGFAPDVVDINVNYLYFDYLKVVEKMNNVKNKFLKNNALLCGEIERLISRADAKILLIEDNVHWHKFFYEFFNDGKIQFDAVGDNFNKLKLEEVVGAINEKVKSFSPDVILLDFRLMEDKDADCPFKQVSGVEVLKQLKGMFNKPGDSFGRQILMFTATSRIENIIQLRNLGADGFILKEKPEQYASKEISKDLISRMVKDLNTSIDRAKFLIPLNNKLKDLKNLISNTELSSNIVLCERVKTVTESVRLITQNNLLSKDVLKLVYLNLFSILEEEKPKEYRRINQFIQENAKSGRGLWNNIDILRNSLAHGKNDVNFTKREEDITVVMIQEWSLKLCDFIMDFLTR